MGSDQRAVKMPGSLVIINTGLAFFMVYSLSLTDAKTFLIETKDAGRDYMLDVGDYKKDETGIDYPPAQASGNTEVRRDYNAEGRDYYGKKRDNSAEGREYNGKKRDGAEGREYNGKKRDNSAEGREYNGKKRDSAEGREYNGKKRDNYAEGRDYNGKKRDYHAEGRDYNGRDYAL